MNANLILQIVQLVIALAQSQLDSGEAARVMLGIVQGGVQAYETATGAPLDLNLIKAEAPIP